MRLVIISSFFIFFFLFGSDGYKILVYNPRFGTSHVTFTGKIADILADAGHEIVVYQPILERTVTKNGSSNPNVRFVISQYDPSKPGLLENQHNIWKEETLGNMIEVSPIECIPFLTKYFRWANLWLNTGRNTVLL